MQDKPNTTSASGESNPERLDKGPVHANDESGTPETQKSGPASEGENTQGGVFNKIKANRASKSEDNKISYSLDEWLELCREDSGAYLNANERLLKSIGEPEVVDTKKSNEQERRVFGGEKISRYKPFNNFYDMEDVISKVVNYLQDGGEGILVFRGPVGSGKTDLAETLEKLMEQQPIYILQCNVTGDISPFNDSPKCLIDDTVIDEETGQTLKEYVAQEYGVPERYFTDTKSKWVTKRLEAANGDYNKAFTVAKVHPSREKGLAIAKVDPKDPKAPDFATLVGEVDMNRIGDEDPLNPEKVEGMSAGDPDAYLPGAFSRSHQGIFHGAEFLRNNPALMNPFLEGVTTGDFAGDKNVGQMPMKQIRVFTTNDPVWQSFTSEATSDAAKNRIKSINVPYSLRMSENKKIYEKLLKKAGHDELPMAPKTLDIMAEFAVSTYLTDGKEGALKPYSRHVQARVLNGERPDGSGKSVPTLREIKQNLTGNEGMHGFTLRDAERVLKDTFNARATEGIREADPILLFETLREFVKNADGNVISEEEKKEYHKYIDDIAERYKKGLSKLVNSAIIDADDSVCQAQFDRYILLAEKWLQNEDYIDPDSGERTDFEKIEKFLQTMESKAGIQSNEEFRAKAVAGIDRELANIAKRNEGKPVEEQEEVKVRWDAFEPMAKVIRAQHESDQESRRHILKAKSDADLKSDEEKRQYNRFHENMHQEGFTDTMISRALHHLNFT